MIETAAIVLAAGQSTRYRAQGGLAPTKLVDVVQGEAMIRHVLRAVLASRAWPAVVVTGHARAAVEACLDDPRVRFADNPDFAGGLASSLRVGLAALGPTIGAAVVLLGDMPFIEASTIDRLIGAAEASTTALAVVPVHGGTRGNPVLLRRGLFEAASRLTGDEGARKLLRDPAIHVVELDLADEAVRRDIDDVAGFAAPRTGPQ